MTIASAFNNAFSGLSASAKRAEIVSNNVANAMTENFGRREVEMSSYIVSGYSNGVRVENVTRVENLALTAARREADGKMSEAAVREDFTGRVADMLGQIGDKFNLTGTYQSFEGSLTFAANNPSSEVALNDVVYKANDLASELNSVSDDLNSLRLFADNSIGEKVDSLNLNLQRLEKLNVDIREMQISGGDTSALKDEQHALLDQINELIPIKVVSREHGRVSLFTPNGGTLLDDVAKKIEFSPVGAMDHSMTLANGALSELLINGAPVPVGTTDSLYSGGAIGALFEMRDTRLPEINSQMDGLAEDVLLRFQDATVDPSLSATDPGLFTDDGLFYSSGNQLGLAGRISLNIQVDPLFGGNSWRLRDGLNSAIQGDVGNNTILRNLVNAFQADRVPSFGIGVATSKNAFEFASIVSTDIQHDHGLFAERLEYETAQSVQHRQSELGITGVNTDQELQDLIQIESAYAANAKVMSVLNELLSSLLEI